MDRNSLPTEDPAVKPTTAAPTISNATTAPTVTSKPSVSASPTTAPSNQTASSASVDRLWKMKPLLATALLGLWCS
jgi:hypothetical protein